ncbi:MAG: DUF488 domain-containing protein [Geminicoccaceae bacterium]|nr:DUF488 domain-containing protein [Geminicoccaceae bacterium]
MSAATGFCSVGHSNRTIDSFTGILRAAGVTLVVDVRSFPRSRSNPVFNEDVLPGHLARCDIGYRHMGALGGRRPRQEGIDDELNGAWRNRSFHNYADYALSAPFARAFETLVELGRRERLAMMCSEAVWWRCHRRIVADHLILTGHPVVHLMGEGREETARPTPGVLRTEDGRVIYPARPEPG